MTVDPNAPALVQRIQAQGAATGATAPTAGSSDPMMMPVWVGSIASNPRQADLQSEGRVDINGPTNYNAAARERIRTGRTPSTTLSQGPVSPATSTVGEQLALFFGMSEADVARLRSLAGRAGVRQDYMSLKGFWEDSVRLAAESYTMTRGEKKLTPWQAAELLAVDGDIANKPTADTTQSFDFTDPQAAADAVDELFRQRLGRRASQEDIAAFVGALRGAEEQNPRVRSVTSATDGEGNTTTTERTSGGVDPQAFLKSKFGGEYGDEEQVRLVATQFGDIVDRLIGSGRI